MEHCTNLENNYLAIFKFGKIDTITQIKFIIV